MVVGVSSWGEDNVEEGKGFEGHDDGWGAKKLPWMENHVEST